MPKRSKTRTPLPVDVKPDSLEELLRDKPGDEKQGAHATLGFSYQQWWAALSVTELLATSKEFAVGMEFKEDVTLLDSPTTPTSVEFCQIKKNEKAGAWTLKELYKKGNKLTSGGHAPSTLAKLYKRRYEFEGHPTKLRFVSNVSFKVPAEDDSVVNTLNAKLEDLTIPQQVLVKADIASQTGIDASQLDFKDVYLHKTNLPLGEQEVFVGGKLSMLFEDGHLPFSIPQPTVAARMLASELQTKAASTNYARSFSELKDRLLSRSDVLNLLAKVSKAKPTIGTVLDEAIDRLNAEGHGFLEIKAIKDVRVEVCADAVNRTGLSFHNLAKSLLGKL